MHNTGVDILAFYDKFEELCKAKGVTPTGAARENGLAQSVISMWKTRGSTPQAATVQKLANYFGVTVDYLLGNEPIRQVQPGETTADIERELGLPEGTISNAPRAEDVEAQNKADMLEAMDKLNIPGQQEAVKRVQEMADIDRYKRRSLSDIWKFEKDGKTPK